MGGMHDAGAHDVDEHFRTSPFDKNLPVLMALMGVWNISFLGYPCRAILPYAQALAKLAPHIQQVPIPPPAAPFTIGCASHRANNRCGLSNPTGGGGGGGGGCCAARTKGNGALRPQF